MAPQRGRNAPLEGDIRRGGDANGWFPREKWALSSLLKKGQALLRYVNTEGNPLVR